MSVEAEVGKGYFRMERLTLLSHFITIPLLLASCWFGHMHIMGIALVQIEFVPLLPPEPFFHVEIAI